MSQMARQRVQPFLSLASQTIIYGLSPMGRRLLVYLTLPLLTTYMGREEFGAVSVLISLFYFFNMTSNSGLPAATFRIYFDDDNPDNRSKTLGSSLVLFVSFAVIMGIVVWIAAVPISVGLLGDPRYSPTVRVLSGVLLTTTLIRFFQIILRIQVRPKAKVLLDLSLNVFQVTLALGLVIVYGLGAFGYWLGELAGGLLGLLLAVWLVKGTVQLAYSRESAKALLQYGVPLLPASLGLWGLRLADRSLITASLGLSEVAVYEVGYKVGMLAGVLTDPFLTAWPQFAFSRIGSPGAGRIYRNVLTALAAISIFVAIFVISFRHELVTLLSPAEYAGAAAIVPWIALSQVAWAMHPIFSLGTKITKNTMHLALVTFAACLVNLGLNFLLIPRIGIIGAAIATFVGYWVLSIAVYYVGNMHYPISLDWRRLIQVVIAAGTALLITTGAAERLDVQWQRISIQVLGLAIYPLVLLLIGFISREQLQDTIQIAWQSLRKKIGT